MSTTLLIAVGGFVLSLATNLAVIVWKFSGYASDIANLQERVTKNAHEVDKVDVVMDEVRTKVEVIHISQNLISKQLTELLEKQDRRLEKLEDTSMYLREQLVRRINNGAE